MDKNKKIILPTINSALLGIMLCANTISVIWPVDSVVVFTTLLCFLVYTFLNYEKVFSNKNFPLFIVISFIVFICIINIIIHTEEVVMNYFFNFLVYGIPLLLISPDSIKFRLVIRSIFFVGLAAMPFYLNLNYGYGILQSMTGEDMESLMTVSYRLLPLIFASFWVGLDRECFWIYRLLAVGEVIVYSFLLFIIASRGALVAYFVFLSLLYINHSKSRNEQIWKIVVIGVLMLIVSLFFKSIIVWLYNYTSIYDFNIRAIDRLYEIIVTNADLGTGRSDIIKGSLDNIMNSPFWGNGIGSSGNFKMYPHNIFIQMMEEGGLIFIVPFAFLFLKGLKILLLNDTKSDYFKLLSVVFCAGIVQLLFSSFFWGSRLFWFFISMLINKRFLTNVKLKK